VKPAARLALFLAPGALVAALTGCSGMYTTAIVTPASVPAPPAGAPAVALVVADQRPPKEGGSDPKRVGTIRALAGNGAGMREESPDAVRRLVEAATVAGLAKGGVSVAAGAGATLEVGIRKFWMDVYSSYTAELHGDLVLKKGGAEVWRKTVMANATGEQGGSPSGMFNTVWGWALERWRDRVAEAASDPEFLAALGVKGAAAAAPAVAEPKTASSGPVGLSVSSEFNIDDRQQLTFEIKARDALKKARLPEKRGAFPEIAIRYVSLYETNPKNGKVNGYKVTTRLSLKDASGRILWEDSFKVKGSFGEIDPKKDANYLDATFSTSVDYEWTSQLVRRLDSPDFRKAAGR
jgi:hypothetical protein